MHANDIAIILLTQNVQLSDVVMPICVDWPKRYQVTNGVTGKVNLFGTNTYVTRIVYLIYFIYDDLHLSEKRKSYLNVEHMFYSTLIHDVWGILSYKNSQAQLCDTHNKHSTHHYYQHYNSIYYTNFQYLC